MKTISSKGLIATVGLGLFITTMVAGVPTAAADDLAGCYLRFGGGSPTVTPSSSVVLTAWFDQTGRSCSLASVCQLTLDGVPLSTNCGFPGTCLPDPSIGGICHATMSAFVTLTAGPHVVTATLTSGGTSETGAWAILGTAGAKVCFQYNPSALSNACITQDATVGQEPVSHPWPWSYQWEVACVVGDVCQTYPVAAIGPSTTHVPAPTGGIDGYVEITAACGTAPTCRVNVP